MIYENGNIRRITIAKTEIIRMIYSTVRDKEWITILPEISDEIIKSDADSFSLSYKGSYKSGDIDFSVRIQIEGKPDSSIILSFEGEALKNFEKNRIGFCVLHPIEGYTGNECIIIHPDKKSERCRFPSDISPHQPFKEVSSMKWVINDSACSLDYFGEIFETEDQRNWTDASYKTYCTPLSLPYPAKVEKGEKISQRIVFKTEPSPVRETINIEPITLSIQTEHTAELPKIGIGRSTRPAPLSVSEKVALAKRHLSYSLDWKGGITGVFEMRQHFSNYFKSLPDFKSTRTHLVTETNPETIVQILDEIAERWAGY